MRDLLPSKTERKYDRQLRLWGQLGQQSLEQSHVLLLNFASGLEDEALSSPSSRMTPRSSCVAAFETLKNLVLGGIGAFTIVDPAAVTEHDLGVNFFLSADSTGKPRAEEVCRYLLELNSAVEGHAIVQTASSYNDLLRHSLVITSGPATLSCLSSIRSRCWEAKIPLIDLRSVGFYGDLAIQLPPEFPLTSTRINPQLANQLRLLHPWEELDNLCREICMTFEGKSIAGSKDLPDSIHSRIPYALILLEYIQLWQLEHDGSPPASPADWRQLSAQIQKSERTNNPDEGEDNFKEAAKAALQLIAHSPSDSVPEELEEIFAQCPPLESLDESTSHFWFVICALREFVQKHGVLPLPGTLPDMTAATDYYVKLQNVYRNKAVKDVQEVKEIVERIGRSRVEKADGALVKDVPIELIEQCCKNGAELRYFQGWKHYLPEALLPNPELKASGKPCFSLSPSHAASVIDQMGFDDRDSALPIRLALTAFELLLSDSPDFLRQLPSSQGLQLNHWLSEGLTHRIDQILAHLEKLSAQPNNCFSSQTSSSQPEATTNLPDEGSTVSRVDKQLLDRIYKTSEELLRPVLAAARITADKSTDADGAATRPHSCSTATTTTTTHSPCSASEPWLHIPELHQTGAVIGGVAAQEAVKILTGQFLTRNYSIVWEGVQCRLLVDEVL